MKPHIFFDARAMRLHLLDQRLLPNEQKYFVCANVDDVVYAIKNMVVRGAPAIGVTAAWSCVLAAANAPDGSIWRDKVEADLNGLASSRPTAVNLVWAIKKMRGLFNNRDLPDHLQQKWLAAASEIENEDRHICQAIGKNGESLIQDGDTILTHCNAGALATAGYGTALGIIRAAWDAGKKVSVIADETRPLLQGARLTAFELSEDGIPVQIACDNACATLLSQGRVNLVIAGADRVAANGDTANKIGTFGVAIIAKYFNVPFYIACPLSTIDISCPNGASIPIEERGEEEVTIMAGKRIAPTGVGACNFAFDVTPAPLISGIVTEYGILRAPFEKSIAMAIRGAAGA